MDERTVFLNALDFENATDRVAFLDEACAGDPALRQRVDQLLDAYHKSGEFLDVPAIEQVVAAGDPQVNATEPANGVDQSQPAEGRDETLMHPSDTKNDGEDVSTFLQPSDKPTSLGRLGHYEVEEIIGQGGFGTVLRAFDEKLRRVVAIKVMTPQLAASATARKRFIREAQAAAAIRDEHVVAIHAVEEAGPLPFLVMEFIDGVTLSDKIEKDGGCEVKEILRIGMQAAKGLAAAHQQGLIHRDIKPANILLENGVQRVKITDFGLARATDDASLTGSGVIAGTPMYMSPEQAEGKKLDHRSDLFSLGSVLYTLCVGRPAFRAESTVAVLKRVCEETPRSIREINSEIPDWLEEITTVLMAKEPSERFQTAKEVADLLSQHLSHLQDAGETPRPKYVRRQTATSRRRLLVPVAAAVLLLALGSIITWLVLRFADKPEPRRKAPVRIAADNIAQGRKLINENRLKEARAQFEKALAHDPKNVDAASELANLILASKQANWTVLEPIEMIGLGGESLTREKDGVIFVSGPNPKRAIYKLTFKTPMRVVGSILLETLPDRRLPKGGAGRNIKSGNFHLGRFSAAIVPAGGLGRTEPIPIAWVKADVESEIDGSFKISNVLDGNPQTRWDTYPRISEPHWAIFGFTTPIQIDSGYLTITLDSSSDQTAGLGRFRISAATGTDPLPFPQTRQNLDAFAVLGAAYLREGNSQKAVAAFVTALENSANASALAKNAVDQAVKLQDVRQGLLNRLSKNADVRVAIARRLLQEKQPQKAQHEFEKSLAIDPDNVTAASDLSNLILESKKAEWVVLKPVEMNADGGQTLTLEPDGSIFVSGPNPEKTIYTLEFKTDQPQVNAIRLETIPDSRLPFQMAGRYPKNGHYHLAEVTAAIADANGADQSKPVSFSWAAVDFQSGNGSAGNLIDGDPDSIWTNDQRTNRPHWAVFGFQSPVQMKNGRLIISLFTNNRQHGLGRFRVSILGDPSQLEHERRRLAAQQVADDPWERLAIAYHVSKNETGFANCITRKPQSLVGLVKYYCELGDRKNASAYYAKLRQPGEFPRVLVDIGAHKTVSTKYVPFDRFDAFTIEAWVRAWKGQIVQQGKGGDPENNIYLIYGEFAPWKYSGWESGPGTNYDVVLTHDAKPGWRHIAMTYDGRQRRFFIDGRLVQEDIVPKPGPLTEGRELDIGGRGTKGLLGAVRISKSARYAADFTPSKTLPCDPDTVLLYDPSRQKLGSVLRDLTGNGRDAKVKSNLFVSSE